MAESDTNGAAEAPRRGELVPQPHGGAIWHGAPANPVAGPGRPPSVLRELAREAWCEGIPVLKDIVNGRIKANAGERVRAQAELSKVGQGGHVTVEDLRFRVKCQIAVIREELEPELAERVLRRIREIWRA